jgi:tRNA modification GTPase
MEFFLDDTIAALASAPGPAARGILRVSGPGVRRVVEGPFTPHEADAWQNVRTAWRHPGTWRSASVPAPLPIELYLWPARRSYTGEPLAELHTVGSPPLLEAVLGDLFAAGSRPARPGEFTLRAFLSGRVDLVQAEAVLGVIDAQGQRELQAALEQLAGGLSGKIGGIRGDLLDLLAELEAGLDFTEEGIEFISRATLVERLQSARDSLQTLLDQAVDRMQSLARRRVVLAGLPNAGKSTLFNALAGQPLALVSPVRGTTRDYLCAELDWDGFPLELVDTAGWETDADPLLREALRLREDQLQRADLIVWCTAADAAPEGAHVFASEAAPRPVLQVATKADLLAPEARVGRLCVSAVSGSGLAELRAAVVSRLTHHDEAGGQLLGTTAARCRESLQGALAALDRTLELAAGHGGEEFLAMDVRDALAELGKITGAVYTDDILDRIFSKFCIGK